MTSSLRPITLISYQGVKRAREGYCNLQNPGGSLKFRIQGGGVIELEVTKDGSKLSHDYPMNFPDTLLGRMLYQYFKNRRNGEKAAYYHDYRELVYFKEHLDKSDYPCA